MASQAAAAAAWQRLIHQSNVELGLRSRVPPGYRDPVADLWHEDGKS